MDIEIHYTLYILHAAIRDYAHTLTNYTDILCVCVCIERENEESSFVGKINNFEIYFIIIGGLRDSSNDGDSSNDNDNKCD